ncbi:hypothetical protein L9F63_016973, partial [Diploptera punctata]
IVPQCEPQNNDTYEIEDQNDDVEILSMHKSVRKNTPFSSHLRSKRTKMSSSEQSDKISTPR